MTTVGALIERLQSTYKRTDHIAVHIWCTEDVIGYGEEQDRIITQAEAEDVIEYIDGHIDCELGITWVTIDCAIDEVLKFEDEEPEVDEDPNHHALPEDETHG